MQNFEYYSPCKILFGRGVEDAAGKELAAYGASRVFLVFGGGSVVRSGLLQRVEASLDAAGLQHEAFGGAKPNPLVSHAREGVKKALAFGSDFILAVGGGSAIDTAKAIAHGAANPDVDIWAFWLGHQWLTRSLPVGSVLTIPAAGSETSNSAVLTNEETGEKRGLTTDFNVPKLAFMNPELTFTLSDFQVACGITDIMMHTLDRYFTHTKGNELTDAIAEAVLRTTIKNGAIAAKNHQDYEAMSELMWCGSISHNRMTGLGAETDFSTHKLGHELSAAFDVAHGASLSTVWGSWAKYVYQEEPERFALYGKRVWDIQISDVQEAALAAIDATVGYFRSINAPTCFTALGIGTQDDATLRALAHACTSKTGGKTGFFKRLSEDDVYQIYKMANH